MAKRPPRSTSPDVAEVALLPFVEPCLAQMTDRPPSGAPWVHEIKYDGYRVQAQVKDGQVKLLTRTGLNWTARYGTLLAGEVAALGAKAAIIDGEVVVQDAHGVSDFQLLQAELKKTRNARVILMAFDLMHLDGRDMLTTPLGARKERLAKLLGERPPAGLVRYSSHMMGDGADVLASADKLNLEGIVSKRLDRPYRSGRTGDWLKKKCIMTDPFVVVGFTPLKTGAAAVGALVMAYWHDGELTYAGRVGTGFTQREAAAMLEGLSAIKGPAPKWHRKVSAEHKTVVWLEPRLVARVEYRDWSTDKMIRHAAFKGFLPDVAVDQVVRPESFPIAVSFPVAVPD